jgi:hypothetical protein
VLIRNAESQRRKNAWNYPGGIFDPSAPGRFATVVAQPRLGLYADRRRGPRSAHRGHPRASWAYLGFFAEGSAMDESKRRIVKFLEKEIKTYTALSLFLSKEGIKEHVCVGRKEVFIRPSFYKERVKEAKRLVHELRKPN